MYVVLARSFDWVHSRPSDAHQIILAIAAVVSIVLGTSFPAPGEEQAGWIEGVAIIIAIIVVTGYGKKSS